MPVKNAGSPDGHSDPQGMLTAEVYAREFAQRLTPWGAISDGSVVWSFTRTAIDYVAYLSAAYNYAMDTIDSSLDRHGITLHQLEPSEADCPLPLLVRKCLAAWEGWQLATEHHWTIGGPSWPLDLTKWQAFAQLANPFDSLVKLWLTGYQIYSEFSEGDPSMRLFAFLQ